jgi:hypothetical protein
VREADHPRDLEPWPRAIADIHGRARRDDDDRVTPASDDAVLGAAVRAAPEAEVHLAAPDADVPQRQLRDPGREARPRQRERPQRREGVDPEHRLDHLDDRARRPRLR